MVNVYCGGERDRPHRRNFPFQRDHNGQWESLHLCNVGEAGSWGQAEIDGALELGVPQEWIERHYLDRHGQPRARGGVRRTKRGIEIECPAHADRHRYPFPWRALRVIFDEMAERGETEIELHELARRSHVAASSKY